MLNLQSIEVVVVEEAMEEVVKEAKDISKFMTLANDDLIPSLSTTASTKHSREMSYLDETLILSGSRTRCQKNSFVVLVQKEIKFISKTNSSTLKWLSEKALAFFLVVAF